MCARRRPPAPSSFHCDLINFWCKSLEKSATPVGILLSRLWWQKSRLGWQSQVQMEEIVFMAVRNIQASLPPPRASQRLHQLTVSLFLSAIWWQWPRQEFSRVGLFQCFFSGCSCFRLWVVVVSCMGEGVLSHFEGGGGGGPQSLSWKDSPFPGFLQGFAGSLFQNWPRIKTRS